MIVPRMGSDESPFNVSLIVDGATLRGVLINHKVWREEKPKQDWTQVLPTSPSPHCEAKPADMGEGGGLNETNLHVNQVLTQWVREKNIVLFLSNDFVSKCSSDINYNIDLGN